MWQSTQSLFKCSRKIDYSYMYMHKTNSTIRWEGCSEKIDSTGGFEGKLWVEEQDKKKYA